MDAVQDSILMGNAVQLILLATPSTPRLINAIPATMDQGLLVESAPVPTMLLLMALIMALTAVATVTILFLFLLTVKKLIYKESASGVKFMLT